MNFVKRFLLALLFLLITIPAFSQPTGFVGCTADGKPTVLKVNIAPDAKPSVKVNVATAFRNAAAALPAERLVTFEGFKLFVSGLSEESKQNSEVPEAPEVNLKGSCKVSKS